MEVESPQWAPTPDNWLEELEVWLDDQEKWLEENESLDTHAEWKTLLDSYSSLQGSLNTFIQQQENWITQLPDDTKLTKRWEEIVPVLLTHYKSLLQQITDHQESAMTFAKLLLSQGKELLSSAEPPLEDETARTACTSLKEVVSGLTNQIKTLEGVQSVNMLQLISIMHPINRGGEGEGEVTVLVEDEYDDDDDDDDETETCYKNIIDIKEKTGLFLLECQDLMSQLQCRIKSLSQSLLQTNERLIQDLEEVEAWLNHVEQWVWMEPQRMFDSHQSLTRQNTGSSIYYNEEEEDDDDPELLVTDNTSPEELELSLGIDDIDSPGLPPPNLEYEDDDVQEEEDEEEEELELLDESLELSPDQKPLPHTGTRKRDDSLELSPLSLKDSPLSLQYSPQSPLQSPPGPLTHTQSLPALNTQSSPNDVPSPLSLTEGLTIRIKKKSSPDLLADQVFTPDTPEDKQMVLKPYPPVFSDTDDSYLSTGGEGESGSSDDSSLEWIRNIRLFEYRLSSTDEDALQEGDRILYTDLIHQLQLIKSSISMQCEKKDSVLSNAAELLRAARSPDEAREIQLRLQNIKSHWENLPRRIESRLIEMKFERKETELLEWLYETKTELDALPKCLVLPEEMVHSLDEFKTVFDDSGHMTAGEDVMESVRESMNELISSCDEEETRLTQTLRTFEEAFELICDKVATKRELLQDGIKLWEELDSVATPLNEWIERTEVDVKERKVFGDSLDEAKEFKKTISSYRESLHDKYESLTELVTVGNVIVERVLKGSPAYRYLDTVVTGTTQRWQDLVLLLNTVDQELSNILIKWQEYVELYAASCEFINHVKQIAGIEVLQDSQGDTQLLTKFIQLEAEINAFKPKVTHLYSVRKELSINGKVGGKEIVEQEITQLEFDWSNIGDVAQGTLHNLWVEHDNWLQEQLLVMKSYMKEGDAILESKVKFINEYPLKRLLSSPAGDLLQQVKILTNDHEDKLYDLDEKMCVVQSVVESRFKEIKVSGGSTHSHDINKEIVGVLKRWEYLQITCSAVSPVFQLITAQLELVEGLLLMRSSVDKLSHVSGYRINIEGKVEEAMVLFSESRFESLRQGCYDLDTIYRECYAGIDKQSLGPSLRLPSNQDILHAHQEFNNEIFNLITSSKGVMAHFLLLLDWWKEYEKYSKVYWDWCGDIEPQLSELRERTDAASLDDTPQDLFRIAQELMEEFNDKELLVGSLCTTLQNIIHDFNDKGTQSESLVKELEELRSNWEELQAQCRLLHSQLEEESNKLNNYLKKLSCFSERLNAAYTELYDECCTAISPNATPDTLNRQKMKLEKFNNLMKEMSEEFTELRQSGEKWGLRHIPTEWVEEFRETSPALSDDDESSHCSVGRQLATSEGRLNAMKKMLQDRALDLELCEGSTAGLMSSANELLNWVEESLGLSYLNEAPPGEFNKLLENKENLESLREEFKSRRHLLAKLHQIAATSKGSLSEVNLKKVEALMAQLDNAWAKMEESVSTVTLSTDEVLAMLEVFNGKCREYEEWLEKTDQAYKDCGPIGADLERLEQQQVILEELDNDIREHKKLPEDLKQEASGIMKVAQEGTCRDLDTQAQSLEDRYQALADAVAEDSELCEEAKKDIQDYTGREEAFIKLLEKVTNDYKVLTDKPKRPLGNTQEALDEHADFCIDIESQSDPFDHMYQLGRRIVKTYTPNEAFAQHLQEIYNQWVEFVDSLNERWLQIKGLQGYWTDFEKQVGEFLNWVTEEAKRFSSEVTSTDGEKGVSDHMLSCKNLHATLNEKMAVVDEISELGDILKPDDGEKQNGTKDVESRLNDVNTHWISICQLLDETLEQLSSVYSKVCLIDGITEKETEWLEGVCAAAANKTPTRGVVDSLKEEIDRHKVYIDEIEQHRPFVEVVMTTEPFLLEHSRRSEHEGITGRVKNIRERFENLEGTERVYVEKLELSIPLWEEFHRHREELTVWVQEAEDIYNSDKLKPGNAIITERNLRNAEELNTNINERKPAVQLLSNITRQLTELCVPDDCSFITERTNQITVHVETLSDSTEARREMLDTRLQSWQVFPVEEAKSVQEFLDTIAMEIEDEEGEEEEEELTGEELMEKLKRLEQLQDEQEAKAGNVSVIDKSADNEEIKEALAKNPDISKERQNLMQGWNSASVRLSDKLIMMRLKAELTLKFEKLSRACTVTLERYTAHLSLLLPPSPSLIKLYDEWTQEENELCEECSGALDDLIKYCDSYKDDPRIQIPRKLQEKVNSIKMSHSTAKEKHLKRGNEMLQRVKDWKMYHPLLIQFNEWVTTSKAELSALSHFPNFLTEFLSLTGRFERVKSEVEKKGADYKFLSDNFETHLFAPRMRREEEEEQEEEAHIEDEEREEDEEAGDDNEREEEEDQELTELRKTFQVSRKYWESLAAHVGSFPEKMEPWKRLVEGFDSLANFNEDMNRRVEEERMELRQVEERGANPAPVLERCKQIAKDRRSRLADLNNLEQSLQELVTPEVADDYQSAQDFSEQCEELRTGWNELDDAVHNLIVESDAKATQWEERATNALRDLEDSADQLRDRDRRIREKDTLITQLRRQQHPPAASCAKKCFYCGGGCMSGCFLTIAIIILLICLLVVVVHPHLMFDINELGWLIQFEPGEVPT